VNRPAIVRRPDHAGPLLPVPMVGTHRPARCCRSSSEWWFPSSKDCAPSHRRPRRSTARPPGRPSVTWRCRWCGRASRSPPSLLSSSLEQLRLRHGAGGAGDADPPEGL